MLFTTPTQYIALAVALFAGWLFGLASHPGGKKWKARYATERDAHAATAKRVAELEGENARLARAVPAADERVVPVRDDRPLRDERPVYDERPVGDAPLSRDDRALRDENDRLIARDSAAPAHPVDRRII
jgi:hypothetical protein